MSENVAMKPEELKKFLRDYAVQCKEIYTTGQPETMIAGIYMQFRNQGLDERDRHTLIAYLFDFDSPDAGLSKLNVCQLRALRKWIGAVQAITNNGYHIFLPRNEFADELRWALVAAKKHFGDDLAAAW